MAKKIKITEAQLKRINQHLMDEGKKPEGKKLRITESQYNRLFKKKVDEGVITEDIGIWTSFLEFAGTLVGWLNDLTYSNSTAGLDPIWSEFGITKGAFFRMFMDLGIIGTVIVGGKKVYKVSKRKFILNLKRLYNEFSPSGSPRYDHKTGKKISDDAGQKLNQESMGDDFEPELDETTTTGGVGGSFEAPMTGSGEQKKYDRYPDDELKEDEEVLDETTSTGDASGAYVQPKIWAKNPENSRFSNDPMYPNGKIIKKSK